MLNKTQLEKLRESHPALTNIFLKHQHTPLREYSKQLFLKSPGIIEDILLESFRYEWEQTGYSVSLTEKACSQLMAAPVLQTAHHVTPTHGPTFTTIDLTCLSGLLENQIYLVAANSGVAFSNTAWSGALSYGDIPLEQLLERNSRLYNQSLRSQKERSLHGDQESRISLIPSKSRDQLVYGTRIETSLTDTYRDFTPDLRKIILPPMENQLYSRWASRACAHLQEHVFLKNPFLIFDINQVVRRYLIAILKGNRDHPIKSLLFSSITQKRFSGLFRQNSLFLSGYQGKKSQKIENLFLIDGKLQGKKSGLIAFDKDYIIDKLLSQEYSPGLILVFFIIRFLNPIRCLGSFNQIEYLESHRKSWMEVRADFDLNLKADGAESLTTGRLFLDQRPIWPLDLALKGENIDAGAFLDMEMGNFWGYTLNQLTRQQAC
ncbi:MAG: hypothetical protein OEY59_00435 [Deltaproteobacteria bacterium]|nr:hypothetical protein [Deltaproteobacteria bacterium]